MIDTQARGESANKAMGAGAPLLSLASVSPPSLWGTSGFSLCVFVLVCACVAGRGSCHREKVN